MTELIFTQNTCEARNLSPLQRESSFLRPCETCLVLQESMRNFFDQSILQGTHILHKGSWEFYHHVLMKLTRAWGWCPSSYIVAQYLLCNYELQPVNGLCILHNCVCQVKVVIEAKKEEKSGDIRWGHDHREKGTMWQLHIVSIPNSSQEERLVFFFQCNFMVQLKSAQTV
jgi:hypothetical protein